MMSARRKRTNESASSRVAISRDTAANETRPPASRRLKITLSVIVLAVSSWLLFFHLDGYYFWGDEADTVLLGRGIVLTGDTSAVFDHNLYAYGKGALLKNLRARYQPPLAYYFVAPFVGSTGTATLWPRIPFAACALITVALLLYWLWQCSVSAAYWIAFSLALVGNVQFFLFGRQCRYNAISTLLAVTIAYLYFHWRGRWWMLACIEIASILLISDSYLAHAALYGALACDYVLFQRRRQRVTLLQIFLLLVPQLIFEVILFSNFNPLASHLIPSAPPGSNLLLDHLTLVWYFFRDLNNSELCVGLIILAAPLLYFWNRNIWLLRGFTAVVAYTLTVGILQPFPLSFSKTASARYMSDEIPLCIALSALVVATVTKNRWQLAAPVAAFAFGFSVLNFPNLPWMWCSRPYFLVREIANPRETATGRAVAWIKEHVRPGETIWVLPDYMQYSLMYYCPEPLYAWQLRMPREKQFESLPNIHFFGYGMPPDYFIVFGLEKIRADKVIQAVKANNIEYELVDRLNIFWNDLIRPEIQWRSFFPIQDYDSKFEDVYIYKLKK